MLKKSDKILLGATFKGNISNFGFLIFIIGVFVILSQKTHGFSILYSSIGFLLAISGSFLFLNIKGVLIDKEQNLIKPYLVFNFIKIGKWVSLNQFDTLLLTYKNESKTMNSRFNSTKYYSKTFEIILTSKIIKDIKLKEFENYIDAKACLIAYTQLINIDSIDS